MLEVMNWKPASDAGSVFESVHLTSSPACCDGSELKESQMPGM